MLIWCDDYTWNKGVPEKCREGSAFLIMTDPYGKRYLIESYRKGTFIQLIYDSSLLDFRKLTPRDQLGWLRETIGENRYLLRNREHAPILIEEHDFDGNRCRECRFFSPHLLPIGYQKIYYQELGDPFNGVTLFDALGKPVITKKYTLTPYHEFGELLTS